MWETCPGFLRRSAQPRLEPTTSGRKSDTLPLVAANEFSFHYIQFLKTKIQKIVVTVL